MVARFAVLVSALLLASSILTLAQQNGVPVPSQSQSAPPASAETLQAPSTYFSRARNICFPAGGPERPYLLQAEFKAKGANGVAAGSYKDTWMSKTQWRREATFGESRYIRTRSGSERYELAQGPDVAALRFIMRAMEPIPAADKVVESEWKVKSEVIGGVHETRVLSGVETPDNGLDRKQDLVYWFDDSGLLRRTYLTGFQTDYDDFEAYGKLSVARKIFVYQNSGLAIGIRITGLKPSPRLAADRFRLPGYKVESVTRLEER